MSESLAGGVLDDTQPLDDSERVNEGDGATPSLTPSRKSARQAERRAVRALQESNGQASEDDDQERGGRRSHEAGRKKRRTVDKRSSDLLDSQSQTMQEDAEQEEANQAQMDRSGDKDKAPTAGLHTVNKQQTAQEDTSTRQTTSQSRAPQTVRECDDMLRKVRLTLQDENLGEADVKKFKDFEIKLLLRRQVLFQREQGHGLTGELKRSIITCRLVNP
jgi:hypothetical protein